MDEQPASEVQPVNPNAAHLAPFVEALKRNGAVVQVRVPAMFLPISEVDGAYLGEQLTGLVQHNQMLMQQVQALAKANQHAAKELAHYTRKRPSKLARVLRKNGRGH